MVLYNMNSMDRKEKTNVLRPIGPKEKNFRFRLWASDKPSTHPRPLVK